MGPEVGYLTPRRIQVLKRVILGQTNKEIAAELEVSEQAVKRHVSALLRMFAVSTRAGLVAAALGPAELAAVGHRRGLAASDASLVDRQKSK